MPADNLSAALSDVLDAWQLSSAKQVAITTDNGSNIVLACSNLDWLRLSCFGHNLNLAVRKSHSKKRFVILTKFVKTTHCQNNTFLLYTQDIVITARSLLLVTSSCLYK